MMNFIYDPILGLQYSFVYLLVLDLCEIPINFNYDQFMEMWSKMEIQLINSDSCKESYINISEINTNAYFQ